MALLIKNNSPTNVNLIWKGSHIGSLSKVNFNGNTVWSGNTVNKQYMFNNNNFYGQPEIKEINFAVGSSSGNQNYQYLNHSSYGKVLHMNAESPEYSFDAAGYFITLPPINVSNYKRMVMSVVYATFDDGYYDNWLMFGIKNSKIEYDGEMNPNVVDQLDRCATSHVPGSFILEFDIEDLSGDYVPHIVFTTINRTVEVMISEIYMTT